MRLCLICSSMFRMVFSMFSQLFIWLAHLFMWFSWCLISFSPFCSIDLDLFHNVSYGVLNVFSMCYVASQCYYIVFYMFKAMVSQFCEYVFCICSTCFRNVLYGLLMFKYMCLHCFSMFHMVLSICSQSFTWFSQIVIWLA